MSKPFIIVSVRGGLPLDCAGLEALLEQLPTLLSMLGALLRPTSGEIRLNGDVISALKEKCLPGIRLRKFGFVFQDFNLLSALTALENVSIVAELAGVRWKEARRKRENQRPAQRRNSVICREAVRKEIRSWIRY